MNTCPACRLAAICAAAERETGGLSGEVRKHIDFFMIIMPPKGSYRMKTGYD